ncbi:MAG: TRAM domain-containing protein, partial [Pseudomonadota bacterium]
AAEKPQLPDDVAHDRLQRLQALLRAQQQETQASMVGREVKVLFEKAGREPGQMIGKSEYLHAVYADAPADVLGQVCPVKVLQDSPNSLKGELIA